MKLNAGNSKPQLKLTLSEEDEILPKESHLILRIPKDDPHWKTFSAQVSDRTIQKDLLIEFTGDRIAKVMYKGIQYRGELVDLPCIIESQKTWDRKQFYKISDISQALIIQSEKNEPLRKKEAWPHGLTPPMQHVRQRRFRKRIPKKAAEWVEEQVEKLLAADSLAESVEYRVYDGDEIERSEVESMANSQMDFEKSVAESVADEDSDEDLAKLIDQEMERQMQETDEESETEAEEEESEKSEEEEDEDEMLGDSEKAQLVTERNMLNSEVNELLIKIQEIKQKAMEAPNPVLKKRFFDTVEKLEEEVGSKGHRLNEIKESIAELDREQGND